MKIYLVMFVNHSEWSFSTGHDFILPGGIHTSHEGAKKFLDAYILREPEEKFKKCESLETGFEESEALEYKHETHTRESGPDNAATEIWITEEELHGE